MKGEAIRGFGVSGFGALGLGTLGPCGNLGVLGFEGLFRDLGAFGMRVWGLGFGVWILWAEGFGFEGLGFRGWFGLRV